MIDNAHADDQSTATMHVATVSVMNRAVPFNFARRVTISFAVLAGLIGAGLMVSSRPSPALAVSDGFVPASAPLRFLDTRPGESTIDGKFQGTGMVNPGWPAMGIQIRGRPEVGDDAVAVVLNVTVTQPQDWGFATIFPCDAPVPNASNLNFGPNQTIPNLVIATIGTAGDVCLYTSVAAHFVIDYAGYFPTGAYTGLAAPQRLLDTRPGETTTDGHFAGIGAVAGGTAITVVVAGRAVPSYAESVVLNVTVTGPQAPGFATLYPCDVARPTASNLNFAAGVTIANAVVTTLSDGDVCLYTHSTAHFIIDVAGALPS